MSRAIPKPTKISEPFWAACRAHALHLQQCSACGHYLYFPVYMCPHCAGMALEWKPVSGRGHIYSHSTITDPVSAAFPADGPVVVALIELEEGPVMMSNIVGDTADQARIGDPVRVAFRKVDDVITLPVFERV